MSEESSSGQAQLIETLRVIRRRKWFLVLGLVLGLAGAVVYVVLQPKEYTATSTVLVSAVSNATQTATPPTVSNQELQTDATLMTSAPIKKTVERTLSLLGATVTATASPNNNIISVSVTSNNARRSARLANAYTAAFVTYQKVITAHNIAAATRAVQIQSNALGAQISKLQNSLLKPGAGKTSQAASIEAEINALLLQETSLSEERAQILISSQLSNGGVTVAAQAVPPTSPSSPRPKRDVLLGGLIGLLLGIGLAFGVDRFDDTIRSKKELEAALPKVPVLGLMPFVDSWKVAERPYLVSLSAPHSPAAEAFRSLRTALRFASLDSSLKSLLVTSTTMGEGKSTTVSNLGVTIAKSGQRVCVVSADLRRPRLGDFFLAAEEPGLTSVVLGEASLDSVLVNPEDLPGLFLLPAGPLPIEPSEFLASGKTAEVLIALKDQFDLVLIDTPPLLPVADALIMSAYADGVLLVTKQGQTRRRDLARGREMLSQSRAKVVGVVFEEHRQAAALYGSAYGPRSQYYGPRDHDADGNHRNGNNAQPTIAATSNGSHGDTAEPSAPSAGSLAK